MLRGPRAERQVDPAAYVVHVAWTLTGEIS